MARTNQTAVPLFMSLDPVGADRRLILAPVASLSVLRSLRGVCRETFSADRSKIAVPGHSAFAEQAC